MIIRPGQTYGDWTTLASARQRRVLCRCICGTEKAVCKFDLRNGTSKGCQNCAHRRSGHHRGSHTRLWSIWKGVRRRCEKPNDPSFAYYGGRGISVCPNWSRNFAAFRAWAEVSGYEDHLTIDRVNPDGNYEPDNCRWATYKEQNRNRRNTNRVNYRGTLTPLISLAEQFHIKPSLLRRRLRDGWVLERALGLSVGATQ